MAHIPRDLTDRIRDLERAVRQLTSAANRTPAQTDVSGRLTVSGSGSVDVVDSTGRLRVRIGVQDADKTLQVWDATGTLVLTL
ncbi:hypothetical protein [Streptomyces sp. MNP-20]|uniref:hypothetical protein n=1 Tax=Streptomyces sp. MNP-20 TaxID=2721165 RepID=UPI00155317F0|nr:hypothetical protein [Streptomyces sp. MNP-20]